MPYNMSSLHAIRDLLREIGGEAAAKVMPTPTFSVCLNDQGHMLVHITAGKVTFSIQLHVELRTRKCGVRACIPFSVRESPGYRFTCTCISPCVKEVLVFTPLPHDCAYHR